jgi:hypothetical protein
MTINLTCHSRLLNPISLRLKGKKMQMSWPRFPDHDQQSFSQFGFEILAPARDYNSSQGGLPMWPLGVFLFLATAVPQQNSSQALQQNLARKLLAESQRNTCYTMRSYFFRRQDGQAPVPAGMSTCTPANVSRQLQVSPGPPVRFVPLGASGDQQ